MKKPTRGMKLLIDVLLMVSGPLFVLVLFLTVGHWFLIKESVAIDLGITQLDAYQSLALLAGALLIYSHLLLDINQSSLHPFYRDRLSKAYVVEATDTAGNDEVKRLGIKRLTDLRQYNPALPYHLINTALNSPAGTHPSLRGRKSDIFIFSRWFSGCPATGYFPTAELERLDPHLDLATAMAISGAAASPFMGTKKTPASASLLLAVLNIRLDYWLPLPGRWRIPVIGWMPGPWYLFRQVLGNVNERSTFVNLSDGGHIENLGLYELLRRRCKFIVAVDGECDPDITCSSLVNLQRFARTDFGIEMDIDLSRVKKAEDGTVPFHFLLAKIDYPADASAAGDGEKLVGYLLYLKSSVTGNESPPIARYRAEAPEFSHESTADLFYDEAQFEAYRSLGHHIAMEVFRRELIGTGAVADIQDWFARLSAHLHEPAAQ